MAITKGTFVAYLREDPSTTSIVSTSFDSSGAGLLIAAVCWEDTSAASATFTDNKGNTWQPAVVRDGAGAKAAMCWCVPTTKGSGHTITCTWPTGVPIRRICVLPVNGNFNASDALDVTPQTNQGTSAAPDAGTLTTSAAAVLAQVVNDFNGTTSTAGSGWTKDSVGTGGHFQSRVEAANGTFDPAMSLSSSADWSTVAMAFKETASSAPAVTRPLSRFPNRGPLLSSYGARVIGFVQGIVTAVGAIVDEFLTEAGTATESLTTVVTAVNTATESTTAGESLTNVITALSSVTEAGAASEALAPIQNVPASLTEAAAAADAMAPQAAQFPALTESVTAVDSPAATLDSQPSLIEAASATDSHGTQLVAVEAVTEAGGAIDELFPTGDGGGTGGTENEYDRRVRR